MVNDISVSSGISSSYKVVN